MPPPNAEKTSANRGSAAPALVVRRIQFRRGAPAQAAVLRRFEQPHVAVAMEESADAGALTSPAAWPEPVDHLDVVVLREGDARRSGEQIDRWLAAPEHPDAPQPAMVRLKGVGVVRWRPGRAVIAAPIDQVDEILSGVVDFAFYEGDLRRMEHELAPVETTAPRDVAFTYAVRHEDRAEWPRLKTTMESLYTQRLAFARLEPRLSAPPRSLPDLGRRIFARLSTRADIDARAEAFNDRLETCEGLYEGAVDRAADFRWYHKGSRLEIAIVVLLSVEVVLLLIDLYIRYLEWHMPE